MLAVVVVELVVVVVVLAEKHVLLSSCNKITLYLLYGHLIIIDIIPYVWLFSTYLDNLFNLLVSSGWYFAISAIFFSMFPLLLLIFSSLPEIFKMSKILSDLDGSPRNLLNFLIKPGTFFPSTLVAKEKTPSETEKKYFNIIFNNIERKFKTHREE